MNNIIIAQVDYIRSQHAMETARNIVKTKILNCSFFLTKYGNSRKKYAAGEHIAFHQNMMRKIASGLDSAMSRSDIMLSEARAGRHYWQSIQMICKQDETWKRTYPHASDHLNGALNIGYHYLTKICREILTDTALDCSLGVLHSPALDESLVYDFMEIWRQAAVDSAVIPLFTRTKNTTCTAAHVIHRVQEKMERKFRYGGDMVRLKNIMRNEGYALRKAIKENTAWEPFRTQWGNSMKSPKRKPVSDRPVKTELIFQKEPAFIT